MKHLFYYMKAQWKQKEYVIKGAIVLMLWLLSSVLVLLSGMVVVDNMKLSVFGLAVMCLVEGFCLSKLHEKTRKLIREYASAKIKNDEEMFETRLKIVNLLGLPNDCSKEDICKKMKTLTKEQVIELDKIMNESKKK